MNWIDQLFQEEKIPPIPHFFFQDDPLRLRRWNKFISFFTKEELMKGKTLIGDWKGEYDERWQVMISKHSKYVVRDCPIGRWMKSSIKNRIIIGMQANQGPVYLIRFHPIMHRNGSYKRYDPFVVSASDKSTVRAILGYLVLTGAVEADSSELVHLGIYLKEPDIETFVNLNNIQTPEYKDNDAIADLETRKMLEKLEKQYAQATLESRKEMRDVISKAQVEFQMIRSRHPRVAEGESFALSTPVTVGLSFVAGGISVWALHKVVTHFRDTKGVEVVVRMILNMVKDQFRALNPKVDLNSAAGKLMVAGVVLALWTVYGDRGSLLSSMIVASVVGVLFGSAVSNKLIGVLVGLTIMVASGPLGKTAQGVSFADSDSLISDEVAAQITSVLGILGGMTVFSAPVKGSATKDFVARMKNLGTTLTTFKKMEDFVTGVVKLVPVILLELFAGHNPLVALKLAFRPSVVAKELHEAVALWFNERDEISPEAYSLACADPAVREKMLSLIKKGNQMRTYMREHNDHKLWRDESFKRFDREMDKIKDVQAFCQALNKQCERRISPFVAWIGGQPGIGKSAVSERIINGIMGQRVGIYDRNSGDPYWSGYHPNAFPAVRFNDFGQIKGKECNDATELLRLANPNPYILPMADINPNSAVGTKGTVFSSPLVVCLANTSIPIKPDNVMDNQALLRRRNVCFWAAIKDEFKVIQNGKKMPMMDWNKAREVYPDDEYMALDFYEYNNMAMTEARLEGKCFKINEVIDILKERFYSHMRSETRTIRRYFEMRENPLPAHLSTENVEEIAAMYEEDKPRFDFTYYKFAGKDHPFSNLYMSTMVVNGVTYQSNEHYYQSQKAKVMNRPDVEKLILASQSSVEARRIGHKLQSKEWDIIKNEVMMEGLRVKFQNEKLRKILLDTGSKTLVECVEGDKWFSCGLSVRNFQPDFPGQNYMGKLLMDVRKIADGESYMMTESDFEEDLEETLELAKANQKDRLKEAISAIGSPFYDLERKVCMVEEEDLKEFKMAFQKLLVGKKITVEYYNAWAEQNGWKKNLHNGSRIAAWAFRETTNHKIYVEGNSWFGPNVLYMYDAEDGRILQELKVPGDGLTAFLGILAGVTVAVPIGLAIAGLVHFFRKHIGNGESHGGSIASSNAGDYAMMTKAYMKYAEQNANVIQRFSDDFDLLDLTNQARVKVTVVSPKEINTVNGLVVNGRRLLVPLHPFSMEEDLLNQTIVHVEGENLRMFREVAKKDVVRFKLNGSSFTYLPNKKYDLAMLKMPLQVRNFRNLIPHFSERHVVGNFPASFDSDGRIDIVARHSPDMDVRTAKDYFTNVYTTDVVLSKGKCGTVLLDNRVGVVPTIIALFGGHCTLGRKYAFWNPAPRQLIQQLSDSIGSSDWPAELPEMKNPELAYCTLGKGSARCDINRIGSVPQPTLQTSAITQSMLYGLIGVTDRQPAMLSRRDPRWEKIRESNGIDIKDPLTFAQMKNGKLPDQDLDPVALDDAVQELLKIFRSNYDEFAIQGACPIDLQTAVGGIISETDNGFAYDGLEPLKMTTSSGLPYQDEKLERTHLFYRNDNGVLVPSQRIVDDVTRLLEFAKQGKRTFVCTKAVAKDELLSAKKLKAGTARTFQFYGVDFLLLGRMYNAHFEMFLKRARKKLYMHIGINPESKDWDDLGKQLLSKGFKKGFCGDYSAFDGSLTGQLLSQNMIFWNDYYEKNGSCTREDRIVREVIMDTIIHKFTRMDDLVFMEHQGNPSGNPFTTSMNSICNMLAMLYAYRIYHGTCIDFFDHVVPAVYGDDNVFMVSSPEKFNIQMIQNAVSPIGMNIKPEVGNGEPLDLGEMTFLKRTFTLVDNKWVPTIEPRTIIDIANFNKTGKPESNNLDIVQNRIISMLLFCFFHEYAQTNFLNGKAYTIALQKLYEKLVVEGVFGMYAWKVPVYKDLLERFKRNQFNTVSDALQTMLDYPTYSFDDSAFRHRLYLVPL